MISVDEYLHTAYHPDCEYIDGEVVERNFGDRPHSKAQRNLIGWFGQHEKTLATICFPGQRMRLSQTRFRVPDVCVFIGQVPDQNIFRTPPFLAIEILSPEDRASSLQEKIEDYRTFGVPRNPKIEIPLDSLFVD